MFGEQICLSKGGETHPGVESSLETLTMCMGYDETKPTLYIWEDYIKNQMYTY